LTIFLSPTVSELAFFPRSCPLHPSFKCCPFPVPLPSEAIWTQDSSRSASILLFSRFNCPLLFPPPWAPHPPYHEAVKTNSERPLARRLPSPFRFAQWRDPSSFAPRLFNPPLEPPDFVISSVYPKVEGVWVSNVYCG